VNFQFESLGKKACVWLECDGCSEGQQHTCFCGQGFLFFSLALFIKNSFCRCFFFGLLVTLVYTQLILKTRVYFAYLLHPLMRQSAHNQYIIHRAREMVNIRLQAVTNVYK